MKSEQKIKVFIDLVDNFFTSLRIPICIVGTNQKIYCCRPICGNNTWPQKMARVYGKKPTDLKFIHSPTLFIKEDAFYCGIIPLSSNLYVIIGPLLNQQYTLSELILNLSVYYTNDEIIAFHQLYLESGHMDTFRFVSIFSLFSEALLHKVFSPDTLYENRVEIDTLPFFIPKHLNKSYSELSDLEMLSDFSEKVNLFLETGNSTLLRETFRNIDRDRIRRILSHGIETGSSFSEKCERYIINHIREKISAKDIADALELSERTLYREFKKHFNMSLNDYIHTLKVKKARELIIYTDMSIYEISNYYGYSSQSHFNKTFEKIEGITPGEFRKTLKNSAP